MAAHRCLVLFFCVSATVSVTVIQNDRINVLERYIDGILPFMNERYRLHFHLIPPVGWMNDPNGFSFFKGEYHLFYQFYPFESAWGPMHWAHSSSPDLVNWQRLPTALIPDEEQCFSGSAIENDDGELVLMYTAHIPLEGGFNQTQYLAHGTDGINFEKYSGNPVLPTAPNMIDDFRDPKVWKHGNYWYTVIGSKNIITPEEHRGTVVLYRSSDWKEWEHLSTMQDTSLTHSNLGYMWECPDFFELDGKFILLISPQGMAPVGDRYKNTFQTGYIIGDFNYETFEFVHEGEFTEFHELDYGHDFYAAQTMERNGRRYLVSWFGMWEVPIPERVDGWAGAMTIVRELKLEGNRLLMIPVENMTTLRDSTVLVGNFASGQVLEFDDTAEIILTGDLNQKIELLLDGKNGGGKAWIRWDPEVGKVVVDREGPDNIRQVEWVPIRSHSWRLFLDVSSLELFCGEGEVVFSSRVYPNGPWKVTNLSPQTLHVEAYHLKRSISLTYTSSSIRNSQILAMTFIIPFITFFKGLFV